MIQVKEIIATQAPNTDCVNEWLEQHKGAKIIDIKYSTNIIQTRSIVGEPLLDTMVSGVLIVYEVK